MIKRFPIQFYLENLKYKFKCLGLNESTFNSVNAHCAFRIGLFEYNV